jgi:zinc transporter 1/2/3
VEEIFQYDMAPIPKIASCVTLFIVTFFFGILPCGIVRILNRRIPKSTSQQKYMSWMNCFAGGIFFGTTFLHLIPESLEEIHKGIQLQYPIGEVVISCGFFLILFLEHLFGACFVCCRSVSLFTGKSELQKVSELKENEYEINAHNNVSLKPFQGAGEENSINGDIGQINRSYDSNHKDSQQTVETTNIDTVLDDAPRTSREISVLPDVTSEIEVDDGERVSSFAGRSYGDHEYEDIEGIESDSEEGKISFFRATVLVIALSLHMMFEGLALGLQDNIPAVWALLIVISVHKCIVATGVGLKLNGVLKNLKQIAFCLFLFSLITPLGIMIGILINSFTSTKNIVSGILECIAAGSFLYVTFFEILQREFNDHHNMIKVLITILGFGVTAGATLLQTHYHAE